MEFVLDLEGPLPLKFDMSLDEVIEILGKPQAIKEDQGDIEAYWFDNALSLSISGGGKVYYSFFSCQDFQLKRGDKVITYSEGTIRDLIFPTDEIYMDDEDSFLVKPIGIVGDWNLEEPGYGSLVHANPAYLELYEDLGYEPINFSEL